MRSGEALIVRAGALAAGLALLWAVPAGAATITLETDADQFDENGTQCSLREAIEAARTNQAFGGCPKGSKKPDKIEMLADVVLSIDVGTGPNAGGDLDHDGGGKLTIVGTNGSFSPSQIFVGAGWTERILEVSGSPVTVKNIEISDVDSQDNSGGAIRAVGNKAALKLIDVTLQGNNADLRGGAVACEGCKRLDIRGRFLINGNSASGPGNSAGGAIWSNRPVTIKGKGGSLNQPQISNNSALSGPGDMSRGGGIYVEDDLSVTAAVLRQNQAVGGSSGSGGGIAMGPADNERITLKLTDTTVEENTASQLAGGVNVTGTDARFIAKRSAIIENEAESAGGVYTQADTTFTESAIDTNVATAPDSSSVASGGGVYANYGGGSEANVLRFVRSSITNNEIASGNFQTGAGITASGTDLELINSTVSDNEAPFVNANGGGVFVAEGGVGLGSARIEFTTFRGNEAGTGSDDGDAMFVGLPTNGITIRASIIDQGADGCEIGAGSIESLGFNVEDVIDTDCGIDAATDSHDSDFLNALVYNGSPPVGMPGIPPFDPVTLPLTNAFTNNSSAALDLVPPGKCKVKGRRLATDARGVPRPQDEGGHARSIERVACRGVFVIGPDTRTWDARATISSRARTLRTTSCSHKPATTR